MIPHIAEWGYLIFLSIKSWLGCFSSLWMTLTEFCRPLSGSHFPTPSHGVPKQGGGGVAEHASLMEKGTNGSIRQNVVNKRGKIKGNERQSEMKGVFFFRRHFSWWAVRRWLSILLWLWSDSRSGASNSCHSVSIPPFYCVVITAEASVLFELSQEVPPPQQHLRVY